MSQCVIQAKNNHPGWGPGYVTKYPRTYKLTGAAEGSVRPTEFAKEDGKFVIGRWGSLGVNYVIWLEVKHGSFLRNAASICYPKLNENIKRALK